MWIRRITTRGYCNRELYRLELYRLENAVFLTISTSLRGVDYNYGTIHLKSGQMPKRSGFFHTLVINYT